MPNEFVGAEEPVRGLNNAAWGTVSVVLKNGLPDRVITPGSRFARGWRAPLMGSISLAPIQTDAVPFGFEMSDVLTADGYQVGLTLNTLVRVNDADDYGYLSEFVRRNGRNFGDALIQEVQRGLETWVNSRIAGVIHADLRRRSMVAVLGTTSLPFAFGSRVLTVVSFTVSDQRWDPKAIELENTLKDAPIQRAAAANEEQLGTYRLAIFAPLAQQLGVSAAELAFPERHQVSQQNAKELALELLKPHNRVLWQRDPEMLSNLFTAAGITAPPAVGPYQVQVAPRWPREIAQDEPTAILPSHQLAEDLNVDKRLRRIWLSQRDEVPIGIAGAQTAREAAVLVVLEQPEPVTFPEAAPFSPFFAGLPVKVTAFAPGSVQELVERWLLSLPSTTDVRATADLDDDEVLTLRLDGSAARVREAVKRLNDPASSALPALEALLSFAEVRVVVGQA